MIDLTQYGYTEPPKVFVTVGFRGWDYRIYDCLIQNSSGVESIFFNWPLVAGDNKIPVFYFSGIDGDITSNINDTIEQLEHNQTRGHNVKTEFMSFNINLGGVKPAAYKSDMSLKEFDPAYRNYNDDYFDFMPVCSKNMHVSFLAPVTFESYLYPLWFYPRFYKFSTELNDGTELWSPEKAETKLIERCTKYFTVRYGYPLYSKHVTNKLIIDHIDILVNDNKKMEKIVKHINPFFNKRNYDEVLEYVMHYWITPYVEWRNALPSDNMQRYKESYDNNPAIDEIKTYNAITSKNIDEFLK